MSIFKTMERMMDIMMMLSLMTLMMMFSFQMYRGCYSTLKWECPLLCSGDDVVYIFKGKQHCMTNWD